MLLVLAAISESSSIMFIHSANRIEGPIYDVKPSAVHQRLAYIDMLYGKLKTYEASRDQYPTFLEYFSEILRAFSAQCQCIREDPR